MSNNKSDQNTAASQEDGLGIILVVALAIVAIVVLFRYVVAPAFVQYAGWAAYVQYAARNAIGLAMNEQRRDTMRKLKAKLMAGTIQTVPTSKMLVILDDASRPLAICLAVPILVSGGLLIAGNPARLYRRRHSMQSVVAQAAHLFPEVRPVIGLNLLSPKSIRSGPWRVADSPIMFALHNRLLLDKNRSVVVARSPKEIDRKLSMNEYVLDAQTASLLFAAQLGDCLFVHGEPYYQGILRWPRQHRALLAAFILIRWHNREAGMELLGQLSSPFWHFKGKSEKTTFPSSLLDVAMADDVLKAYVLGRPGKHPWLASANKETVSEIRETIKMHAWQNVVIFEMIQKARERGIVACSDFIWLRPMDRTLWYALQNAGRNNPKNATAFTEGAGVVAHYLVEQAAEQPIVTPQVHNAVKGLAEALYAEGWIGSM